MTDGIRWPLLFLLLWHYCLNTGYTTLLPPLNLLTEEGGWGWGVVGVRTERASCLGLLSSILMFRVPSEVMFRGQQNGGIGGG